MERTWILVADRARARLFETRHGNGELDEVAGFIHVEGQASGRELEQDRDPQAQRGGYRGGDTMEPRTPLRDKIAAEFAHGLAAILDQGRVDHCYERLILVAPPRFLGQLKAQLGNEVSKLVSETVSKDITRATPEEIDAELRDHF